MTGGRKPAASARRAPTLHEKRINAYRYYGSHTLWEFGRARGLLDQGFSGALAPKRRDKYLRALARHDKQCEDHPFRLLDQPVELRLAIYAYLFEEHSLVHDLPHPIMKTSKVVRQEVLSAFYTIAKPTIEARIHWSGPTPRSLAAANLLDLESIAMRKRHIQDADCIRTVLIFSDVCFDQWFSRTKSMFLVNIETMFLVNIENAMLSTASYYLSTDCTAEDDGFDQSDADALGSQVSSASTRALKVTGKMDLSPAGIRELFSRARSILLTEATSPQDQTS